MAKIILYRGLQESQHIPKTTQEQFLDAYLSLQIAQRERKIEQKKLTAHARQGVISGLRKVSLETARVGERVLPDPTLHSLHRLQKASEDSHLVFSQQFSDSLEIALKYAGEDGYVVSISPEYGEVRKYEWGTNHELIEVENGRYLQMPYTLYEIPPWQLKENAESWHMKEQSTRELRELRGEIGRESHGENRLSRK